jgi:hypothetical protein
MVANHLTAKKQARLFVKNYPTICLQTTKKPPQRNEMDDNDTIYNVSFCDVINNPWYLMVFKSLSLRFIVLKKNAWQILGNIINPFLFNLHEVLQHVNSIIYKFLQMPKSILKLHK